MWPILSQNGLHFCEFLSALHFHDVEGGGGTPAAILSISQVLSDSHDTM